MREIPVLMYNNIGNYPENMMEDGILPETFDAQIKYLSESQWNIVKLEQAVDHLTGNIKLPDKSLALTIDGGYYDAFQNVFPTLMKYGLKATFFIPPETIGGERKISGEPIKCMGVKEIKELVSSGMEIGLLANNGVHIRNENYNEDAIKKNVLEELELVHEKLGVDVAYCAFKEGVPGSELWSFLKNNGLKAVFTQCPTNQRAERYGIGRIQIDDDDQNIFFTKISKTYLFFKDKRSWKYLRKYKIDRVAHHISETWNKIKGE